MRRNARAASAILFLLAVLCAPAQTPPENAYIGPAVCASCHPKQAATYRLTGMGRSFYRLNPSNQIENFARGLPYYHEPSATYYGMTVREGRYYQSQYQIGFDGKPVNFVEKQIDYVVGSGNHARTYLSRTQRNTLVELPLAWYSEKGGYWAMNPGYDRPGHEGFNRSIETNCMFCHNAYPDMPSVAKSPVGEAVFPATLPEGIDCQRCHGPGRAHVQAVRNRQGDKIKAAIVNPARLTPARQIEVCLQCHLETTSFPLPNALVRYERGPFSYRPGEPLAGFRLEFDHAPGHTDDFEIASSAYQLGKSACMLKSAGKLSCTTCHNPHDVRHGAEADQQYNAVCRNCHGAPLDRLIATARHTASAGCIGCHMPKRRTADAVHVVMTDHRIQRFKPTGDPLAAIPELERNGTSAYRGEVVRYTPPSFAPGDTPAKPDDELYIATAQVIQSSNLKEGIPRLQAALRKLQPNRADHYAALADALRVSGQCGQAIPEYEEALRHSPGETLMVQKMVLCLDSTGQYTKAEAALRQAIAKVPGNPKLWSQLGSALVGQGRTQEGIAALEKATMLDPELPEVWNYLGEIRLRTGDAAHAEPALRNALLAQPNSAAAHLSLGNLLSATNRFDEAKYHFELALHYRPGDSFTHFRYGLALLRTRQYPEARAQLEKSLQENPNDADAHHSLGLVLDAQGDAAGAIDQYREAVKLRPAFALANLSLGFALVKLGNPNDALPYLKTAAASPDAPIRQRAQALLDSYSKQ